MKNYLLLILFGIKPKKKNTNMLKSGIMSSYFPPERPSFNQWADGIHKNIDKIKQQ